MKKAFYSMFAAVALLASCSSSDDSDNNNTGGFSNEPVSGTVYNEDFTVGGGKARSIELSGTESLYIYLSETAIDCDDTSSNPIWITVPAEVGTYDAQTDGHVQFKDINGDSFEGSLDAKIEITEITETSVKGKVMASGFEDGENEINGTFNVQYCPL